MADFIQGLYINEPHEKAPDFVRCTLSIQRDRFRAWLDDQEASDKGYIRIQVNESKDGKLYVKLDTYKGRGKEDKGDRVPDEPTDALVDVDDSKLPF
jgi:hypothetical protein